MMLSHTLFSATIREARLMRMAPDTNNAPKPTPEGAPSAESFDAQTAPLTSPEQAAQRVDEAKLKTKEQLKPLQKARIDELKKEQTTLLEMIAAMQNNHIDPKNIEVFLASLQKIAQENGISEEEASSLDIMKKMLTDVSSWMDGFFSDLSPKDLKTLESLNPKFGKIIVDKDADNLLIDLTVKSGFPNIDDLPDTPAGKKLRGLLQQCTPEETELMTRCFTQLREHFDDDYCEALLDEQPYNPSRITDAPTREKVATAFDAMNAAKTPEERAEAQAALKENGVDLQPIMDQMAVWQETEPGSPDRMIAEGYLMISGVDVKKSNLQREAIHFFDEGERMSGVIGGVITIVIGYFQKYGDIFKKDTYTSPDDSLYTQNANENTPEQRAEKITSLTKSVEETEKKISELKDSIKAIEMKQSKSGAPPNPELANAKTQLQELEASLKKANEALVALNAAAGAKKDEKKA